MDIALLVEYNTVVEINMENTKKEESPTATRLINGLWRCPSIDVNARSRDCHATDTLRAINVSELNKRN